MNYSTYFTRVNNLAPTFDHLTEEALSENKFDNSVLANQNKVDASSSELQFESKQQQADPSSDLHDYSPNRSLLTQPRPLNPELDIQFQPLESPHLQPIPVQPNQFPNKQSDNYVANSVYNNISNAANSEISKNQMQLLDTTSNPSLSPNVSAHPAFSESLQPPLPRTVWHESDFQLATISSTSTSLSSSSSEWNESDPLNQDLNTYLESCGLPVMDYSQLEHTDKDSFYQHYIREIAHAYERRETIIKRLAKKALLTDEDKPAMDLLHEVNEKVDHILVENHFTSRTSIVENVQHIGRKLKKAEKKSEIADHLLSFIEDESETPSSQVDLRTMDSEYDKRVDKAFKKLQTMKKLRNRYKSLLFMKYKVVDMINRSTESSIDQLIDVEKLIPIIDSYKFSRRRVREILNSKSFTPEWKVNELRELFGM